MTSPQNSPNIRPPEPNRSFASADLDEILNWHATHARTRLSVAPVPPTSSGLHFDDRQLGRIHIVRSRVPNNLTVITASTDVYALMTVQTGALRVDEAGKRWALGPTVAGLYRPPRSPRRNQIAAHTDMTYLIIGCHDLERQLEQLIGQYISGPVDFHPELPLRSARAWLRLSRVFVDAFDDPESAVYRPMVSEPLREAMINSLLYSADHPYQPLLQRQVTSAGPRHVEMVLDAIRAAPEQAYTIARLARLAGVSVRSLQQGFRDHTGMAPTAYLRRVRLERAHRDLLRDQGAGVAETAHRWGFTHLGRFAAAYASVYGVVPSRTRSTIL